eukprot:2266749-Rhodomonas_salina.1
MSGMLSADISDGWRGTAQARETVSAGALRVLTVCGEVLSAALARKAQAALPNVRSTSVLRFLCAVLPMHRLAIQSSTMVLGQSAHNVRRSSRYLPKCCATLVVEVVRC